ncbi:MAG: peptidoglycan-associated lipoprotein Pal [gamma proteobacterium symbiont of Bathyaustriella thionipta]|nr:peptidoglycan-associated lipoprotein Pal [gamma proteobacterium symbiont of Bathyaustriella thionipta]MCU7949703.1 peptidoglycan-associated lipoprotein Pal [gamma proteobacterium symbiont of Bathyaustriella thionipta]MCU7953099.1 peptidoglycan-associated lipoprotein Pal [gamma proteobacterium symbiont of Bathyaustriella thionipta]MCU7956289.1 peptidoglycan-associated lipoprotein Pal [gamma proteobacterium symbiont of Bathyaustriella thionipta]MCU7967651.1 peptidoglycan-associated lipoprotein
MKVQKMILKKLPVLLTAAALSFLTACTTISDDNTGDASVEDRTGGGIGQNGEGYEGQTGGYNDSGMGDGTAINGQSTNGDPLSDPNSPLSIRTIYFEYDSTMINSEGQSALNAHAEYLSLNPTKQLIIEGHTDERGTREYNLSLGERRGNAVADFLTASGVPGQQIEVRSYGEENPVALDHSESAWQLNRRVELLY